MDEGEGDDLFRDERRRYRRQVALTIVAVLSALVLAVLRCSRARERSAPYPVTRTTLPAPSLAVTREPIEFQLVVDGTAYDVTREPIVLPDGRRVELDANPMRVAVGDGFHFKHRDTVSVTQSPEGVIAATTGVSLRLMPLPDTLRDADARALLRTAVTSTGQAVGEPEPVTRTIAGAPRDGHRHRTQLTMVVETYLVALGARRLGILLYVQDARADDDTLATVLETLADGPGEPMPQFVLHGPPATPLFLDRPTELVLQPPVSVTLRRRPAVLRTMAAHGSSLSFEHPHDFSVSLLPNDLMLAIQLQREDVGLQLFDLAYPITVDELRAQLLGSMQASDLGEVVRTAGTTTLRGRKLRLATLPIVHELYVFARDGKSLGATLQYLPEHEAAAVAAALPILGSVH